jgi:hypothetical protein
MRVLRKEVNFENSKVALEVIKMLSRCEVKVKTGKELVMRLFWLDQYE